MNHLPIYIPLLFAGCTAFTLVFLYMASHKSKPVLFISIAWLLLHTISGLSGFFLVTDVMPPRFTLLVGPPLLLTIILFSTRSGRQYIDRLNLAKLTLLHVVRIPVELVLFALSIYKVVPDLMTFEGQNFDILSGLTAPLVFYFGFKKKNLGRNWILAWNFACIGLLLNIVIRAILSAPLPFQQLAFDQPNIALLYFPYVWLPCFIVPVVLFSHLASIRQLLKQAPALAARGN